MNKRLTIAIVAACPFPWPRGTPIRAFRIAESLSQLGHDVHVLTYHLGEQCECGFTIHRIAEVPGYRKTSAGPSIGKLVRLNPALVRLVRELSRQIAFDLVHAIHMEGLLVARRSMPGIPIIYDAHTSLASELPDYLSLLPRRLVSGLGGLADKIIPAKSDFTVAVSEKLSQSLLCTGAVQASRIAVIPNGVELVLFKPDACNRVDANQIVFTGNDATYQRLDLLLDSFRLTLKLRPNARLKLVGSCAFASERAYVKRHQLEGSVSIHTTDFHDELKHLAGAAIAVSPRTVCEGLPQKLLNYMAAGKAIVACEGSAVHLQHEVTGIRVANDAPEAMAESLSRLLSDTRLASLLGANAYREAQQDHSWQAAARKIEQVYARLLRPDGIEDATPKVPVSP